MEFQYALLASGHLPAQQGGRASLLMLSQIFHTNFESNLFVLDRGRLTGKQKEGMNGMGSFLLSFSLPKCPFSLSSSLNDGVERSHFLLVSRHHALVRLHRPGFMFKIDMHVHVGSKKKMSLFLIDT